MGIGTTEGLRTEAPGQARPGVKVMPARSEWHVRLVAPLHRVRRTLDDGESLWTPVIMLAAGYAITIPAFALMWGAALLAAHFAGE